MANLQLNLKVKNMDEFRSKVYQMQKLAEEIENFQFDVEAESVNGRSTTVTPDDRIIKALDIKLYNDESIRRTVLGRRT